nr:monocarboxylate transporter 9-like isoform X2 [Procambarus clarkii]
MLHCGRCGPQSAPSSRCNRCGPQSTLSSRCNRCGPQSAPSSWCDRSGASVSHVLQNNILIPLPATVSSLCVAVRSMLVPLLGPCFGVLFSRFLLQEGSSSTTTAWIFNVQCFVWNMMGLVVRPLAKEFGWRNIAIKGVLLTSVSVIMSAFTPSAEFLFFSFSLLSGVGGGVVVCMCFIIVPMYFDRRRGLANAVMMAGVCTGQIVGPPFVRLLQDVYTFKGATLILGALMLNALVGAAFFHPVEWHMRPACDGTGEWLSGGTSLTLPEVIVKKKEVIDTAGKGSCQSPCSERGVEAPPVDAKVREGIEAPPVEATALSLPSLNKTGITTALQNRSQMTSVDHEEGKQRTGLGELALRVAHNILSDLRIFRSPRAVIISLGCTFFINGYYNFIMMVPFAMLRAGHTLEDAAWCISVSAGCNLLCRILMSALSDSPRFNMRAAYMAGLAATAAAIFTFPLLTELRWLMVTMAVWGCGVGTTMGLYNLVMVTIMGLDNLAPVFGASCLAVGVGFLFLGPLIGVVRDATGSYTVSMWVLAAAVLTSFILWLFMPAAQAYDQRRAAHQAQHEGFLNT